MCITWKRAERRGFIASHWIGYDEKGAAVYTVSQQRSATGRRGTKVAYLRKLPLGTHKAFSNVAAAKAAACQ